MASRRRWPGFLGVLGVSAFTVENADRANQTTRFSPSARFSARSRARPSQRSLPTRAVVICAARSVVRRCVGGRVGVHRRAVDRRVSRRRRRRGRPRRDAAAGALGRHRPVYGSARRSVAARPDHRLDRDRADLAIGACAVIVASGGAIAVVYGLAVIATIAVTPLRAAHSALLPSLCAARTS